MAKSKELEGFSCQQSESQMQNSPGEASFELVVIGKIIEAATLINSDLRNYDILRETIQQLALILKGMKEMEEKHSPQPETEKVSRITFNWHKMKKKRKMAYFYHLKNKNLIRIYNEWYNNMKQIVLPRYLVPKHRPEETREEYQLRIIHSKERLLHETEIFKIKMNNYERKFKSIDIEVKHFIREKFFDRPTMIQTSINEWESECDKEEAKSKQMWQCKETHILSKCSKFQNLVSQNLKVKRRSNLNACKGEVQANRESMKQKNQNGEKRNQISSTALDTITESKIRANEKNILTEIKELEDAFMKEMSHMISAQENNTKFDDSKLENIGKKIDEQKMKLNDPKSNDSNICNSYNRNCNVNMNGTNISIKKNVKREIKSKLPRPIDKIKINHARCKLKFDIT